MGIEFRPVEDAGDLLIFAQRHLGSLQNLLGVSFDLHHIGGITAESTLEGVILRPDAAGNRVDSPVNEQAEFGVLPPLHRLWTGAIEWDSLVRDGLVFNGSTRGACRLIGSQRAHNRDRKTGYE